MSEPERGRCTFAATMVSRWLFAPCDFFRCFCLWHLQYLSRWCLDTIAHLLNNQIAGMRNVTRASRAHTSETLPWCRLESGADTCDLRYARCHGAQWPLSTFVSLMVCWSLDSRRTGGCTLFSLPPQPQPQLQPQPQPQLQPQPQPQPQSLFLIPYSLLLYYIPIPGL